MGHCELVWDAYQERTSSLAFGRSNNQHCSRYAAITICQVQGIQPPRDPCLDQYCQVIWQVILHPGPTDWVHARHARRVAPAATDFRLPIVSRQPADGRGIPGRPAHGTFAHWDAAANRAGSDGPIIGPLGRHCCQVTRPYPIVGDMLDMFCCVFQSMLFETSSGAMGQRGLRQFPLP
jgi:hypothetical protein